MKLRTSLSVLATLPAGIAIAAPPAMIEYGEMADASAAVAIGGTHIAVASDEDNVLRVYDAMAGGPPVYFVDLKPFLMTPGESLKGESDLEGATRRGDLVFWTASFSRNRDGRDSPARRRFFATRITEDSPESLSLEAVGNPCTTLAESLAADPRYAALGLAEALGLREDGTLVESDQRLAPKDRGFNIEGLSLDADGTALLFGFRNPTPPAGPGGAPHALVATLTNPLAVLEDKAAPEFADPILLDLGGMGIRSLEWDTNQKHYVVVAGPAGEERAFAVYTWSGNPTSAPVRIYKGGGGAPGDLAPEAVVPDFGPPGRPLILSDDGARQSADPARPEFRGFLLPAR